MSWHLLPVKLYASPSQSISGENYTPTRPSSLPEYYVFDGWYENELCEGEVYNFTGKKMPAQNGIRHAKWTAKKINLTIT